MKASPVMALLSLLVLAAQVQASPSLYRVEKRSPDDRALLIQAGIHLIDERDSCFLALAEPGTIEEKLAGVQISGRLIDGDAEGWDDDSVDLPPGGGWESLANELCGRTVWADDGWALIGLPEGSSPCLPDSRHFVVRQIGREPLGLPNPPPAARMTRAPTGETRPSS